MFHFRWLKIKHYRDRNKSLDSLMIYHLKWNSSKNINLYRKDIIISYNIQNIINNDHSVTRSCIFIIFTIDQIAIFYLIHIFLCSNSVAISVAILFQFFHLQYFFSAISLLISISVSNLQFFSLQKRIILILCFSIS